MFEILHFLPLLLIAISLINLRNDSGIGVALVTAVLSGVGLVAGEHMHTVHALAFGIVDPCYGYAAAAMLSIVSALRTLKAKFI